MGNDGHFLIRIFFSVLSGRSLHPKSLQAGPSVHVGKRPERNFSFFELNVGFCSVSECCGGVKCLLQNYKTVKILLCATKSGNPILHHINYFECSRLAGCGSLIYF